MPKNYSFIDCDQVNPQHEINVTGFDGFALVDTVIERIADGKFFLVKEMRQVFLESFLPTSEILDPNGQFQDGNNSPYTLSYNFIKYNNQNLSLPPSEQINSTAYLASTNGFIMSSYSRIASSFPSANQNNLFESILDSLIFVTEKLPIKFFIHAELDQSVPEPLTVHIPKGYSLEMEMEIDINGSVKLVYFEILGNGQVTYEINEIDSNYTVEDGRGNFFAPTYDKQDYRSTEFASCPVGTPTHRYRNCDNLEDIIIVDHNPSVNVGNIVSFSTNGYECKCYELIEEFYTETQPLPLSVDQIYETCVQCGTVTNDSNFERTPFYADRIVIPDLEIIDRGFKECNYQNLVFGDVNSNDYEKNDFKGFYNKKQSPQDTCQFVLKGENSLEVDIINDSYGVLVNYGDHLNSPNLKTLVLEWKKVLTLHGEGKYQVIKQINTGGIDYEVESNTFVLKQFTQQRADKTVRIDGFQDSYIKYIDVDFNETQFKTSLRMNGFFGDPQHKFTEDNTIYYSDENVQNSIDQEVEYLFQANLIPSCISEELFDFVLLSKRLYVNDYNSNNHSYCYKKFGVRIQNNKNSKYIPQSRGVEVNLTFRDKIENKRGLNFKN